MNLYEEQSDIIPAVTSGFLRTPVAPLTLSHICIVYVEIYGRLDNIPQGLI
jgi:hypothetical protein